MFLFLSADLCLSTHYNGSVNNFMNLFVCVCRLVRRLVLGVSIVFLNDSSGVTLPCSYQRAYLQDSISPIPVLKNNPLHCSFFFWPPQKKICPQPINTNATVTLRARVRLELYCDPKIIFEGKNTRFKYFYVNNSQFISSHNSLVILVNFEKNKILDWYL